LTTLVANSSSDALDLFNSLIDAPAHDNEEVQKLLLGPWVKTQVYIPDDESQSEISPPFMEAYLEVQKQLFQYLAFVRTGIADSKQLNEIDRQLASISVKVTGGSSDLGADLRRPLERILSILATKMSSKQAAAVVIGLALILAGHFAFAGWLEHQKQIKLEELKSKDHIAALEALRFATREQVEQLDRVIRLVEAQGEFGRRASAAAQAANEALLKAASRTERSRINGTEITRDEAERLRVSSKRKVIVRYESKQMRVGDINTADLTELLTLMDERGNQYKMPFPNTLFSQQDRPTLFRSLDDHHFIWVELAIREADDDEIVSMQFLRVRDDPGKPPDATATTR
jgi:hypothetical protein